MKKLEISDIQIVPIKPKNGLIAFATAVINNQFYIGNIAIYTSPTSSKGYRIVFPTKKLANGHHVDCFYPINKNIGEIVSDAIIEEYIQLMENFHNVI